MRVLFGWEFGAGLGHLTRFRPIGDRLVAEGAEVVLALQDVDRAGPFLDPATARPRPGYRLLQAPRWNIPSDPAVRKIPTHSFADVLRIIGYGHRAGLARRLTAWEGIVETVRPDVVVGDFSPTLNLAARGRVPSVVVGNGYTIPPPGRPMPPIRPWQDSLERFSLDHEAELLDAANGALRARGWAPIDHLADAFSGDRTFVFSLPLVDPYARFRTAPTLAPFNMPRGIRPRPWEERREGGVFLYLPAGHAHVKLALDALAAAKVAGEAFVGELPDQARPQFARPGVTLHGEPQDFATVMPSSRLVIDHAGLSTAVAALMAGTPQLILPWNLEHLVTARAIEATGAAVVVPTDRTDVQSLVNAIRVLVDDRERAARAEAAAASVDLGDPAAGVEAVVAAVRRMAA
jgi:UDP:flavonoid glycosyltransferase YjiC (YdhE family)